MVGNVNPPPWGSELSFCPSLVPAWANMRFGHVGPITEQYHCSQRQNWSARA